MPVIKHIVYEHVLDAVFSPGPQNTMAGDIASSISEEIQDKIRTFLNPIMLEIKNRLPSFPVTRETLSKAPFGIMPALRYVLIKYGSLIEENPQPQPATRPQSVLAEQSEQTDQPNRRRPKKKKKAKKDAKKDKNEKKFVPPRMFSLFPNPSLRWRFIKIDSQNLAGIFPGAILQKQGEETPFQHTQRSFFAYFNFIKLKINK